MNQHGGNFGNQQQGQQQWFGGFPGGMGWHQPSPWHPGFPGSQWFPGMGGSQWFPGQSGSPNQPGRPGQGGQAMAPTSPPPSQTPSYPEFQTFAVDPGAISGCLFRFTYVWTSRSRGFWFYPTFVGRTSVAGFQWNSRRYRWEYLGIDLQRIDAFRCF
ncbi:hypothetical protein [Sporosarcina sp. PTS2304]|uniref:hypothetical protein n=1 Tax=Sporosarcina sp. PTS2304 TaxID=2283194 RepID=UPI001F0884F8|nr:hypothetical protein [Sporosarcina sp. PTS2304]